MDEQLIEHAGIYAARHELRLAEALGSGIHGIVWVAENNPKGGKSALKAHRDGEPFFRECAVYDRLREARVSEILGFNVPQLIRLDEELRMIEMSVVMRPFVLDFAGAYLDQAPDFSEEIWAEWEIRTRERFDEPRWERVGRVLEALEDLEIFMVDVSPGNIAFVD